MACILFILCVSNPAYAASSTNYKIAAEIMDGGAASASSASFNVRGITRVRQISEISSSNFIIGEGFLRSAYFTKITPVLAPIVTAIVPNSGVNSGIVDITNLTGANFHDGAAVKLSKKGQPDINMIAVNVVSSTKIICSFDLTGAVAGLWDVTVTNPDKQSGTLASAFTINNPAPAVASITPNRGDNDKAINITDLAGNNFMPGAAVSLSFAGESDIIASNVVVVSANKITCQFDITGKSAAMWDVNVANTDGQKASLVQAFKIESPSLKVVGAVVSTSNPFYPSKGPTSIKYNLSKDANIVVNIFNMRGEKVWEWTSPAGTPGGQVGQNEIAWNGITAFNAYASFGVYIVVVTSTDGGTITTLSKTKIAIVK